MIREQQIMKRMVDELGDDLNEYIKTFYLCDLWKFKENELIINKTFKRIVEIIADYNITTTDEIFKNVSMPLESKEMLFVLSYLCEDSIKNGIDSLLNRCAIFCYCLFTISDHTHKSAVRVLEETINSDLVLSKTTCWTKFKYYTGLNNFPFEINIDQDGVLLITILKGIPVYDTIKYLIKQKGVI